MNKKAGWIDGYDGLIDSGVMGATKEWHSERETI